MESFGYIETYGYVASVVAADAALKSANVTLTNCYNVTGGRVAIEITGDVAAVKAAIEAGSECAKQLGNFISSNVIARIASETKKILVSDVKKEEAKVEKVEEELKEEVLEVNESTQVVEELPTTEIVEEIVETVAEEVEEVNTTEFVEEVVTEEVIEEPTIEVENEKEEAIEEEENLEEVIQEEVKEEIDEDDSDVVDEITEETEEIDPKKEHEKKLRKKYQDAKVIELKQKVNNLKLGYSWDQIKGMKKKKLIEILIKNNQEE